MDIEITTAATHKILEAVAANKIEPTVRLYVLNAACSGARFGLAFDEPRQYDIMTELEGIEFITDTEYIPKFADGLSIDYTDAPKPGFVIKSLRPIPKSCGGCSKCHKD